MADRDTITVYSDYVCPFCYLGKASLERYQAGHADAPVPVWRPFDLRAGKRRSDHTLDPEADDGKSDAYYERAVEGVRRLAEEYGVEMDVRVHREVDSFPAHLVALSLEQNDGQETLTQWHTAVFDALWKHGKDIGDLQVLRESARKIGLDPERVDHAVEDEGLKRALVARFQEASRVGVTGVPTFVYGTYGVPGAVPPEQIEALIRHVRQAKKDPASEDP